MISRALSIAVLLFLVVGCQRDLEKAEFNVYFYYPGDREVHLGVFTGISSCQRAVRGKAYAEGLSREKWDYLCCLKTSSSECKSKHK